MLVTQVLRAKGSDVVTVGPGEPVRALLDLLATHGIGAAVVVDDDGSLAGIVSERDVVRGLARVGAAMLDEPVEAFMTPEVVTCARDTPIEDLMTVMTQHRIRHVPVVDGDDLIGIVSIGDVVKSRIFDLESERDGLAAYIGG
jgi:CBS domain-containing protein